MEGENSSSVKLFGTWVSSYTSWVKYALKIKGIEFEYKEENLENKSELLLKYNPVLKKVPILVHNELSILDSTIILEYIDEVWTNPPHLLPKDPFLRSKYRFWATYFELINLIDLYNRPRTSYYLFGQVLDTLRKTILAEGEALESLKIELGKKLDVIEEGMKELFSNEVPSFNDDAVNNKPDYLDIMIYSVLEMTKVFEEFLKIKLITSDRYPKLVSWNIALNKDPLMREIQPPKTRLLEHLQYIRQKYLRITP